MSKSVLFVCLGNICRSPTAEAIFRSHLQQMDVVDEVVVDSAGTIGFHQGNPADARMRATGARRGYDLQSLSRKIVATDLKSFDLIVAMDRENRKDIQSMFPDDFESASVKLLSDFLGDQWPTDVPDPYYGGEEGFEYVVDMIAAAVPKLYDELMLDQQ